MQDRIRYLADVIPQEQMAELGGSMQNIRVTTRPSSYLCLLCKGGRRLCGKAFCPVLTKARSMVKLSHLFDTSSIHGSTPPGVFVGRMGYPKVYVGPMLPPYYGDTEILDTPERWLGRSIEQIIDYRYSLIRGKVRAHIFEARQGGRLIDTLQELAMGARPSDSEAEFLKKPTNTIALSDEVQPFGPSAPLKDFRVSGIRVDGRVEKAYYDHDLLARDAVMELYEQGVLVSRIQKAFSMGMFGIGGRRRLVPTRWSITAVDSTLSSALVEEFKGHETIDRYRVYDFKNLDNVFVAILLPEQWSFEWIEAWFPGTTWNPDKGASQPAMMGDHEQYWGRSTYASVGGCYYSTRLAVAEKLCSERRQASALVLREIHPGYIVPVGVWNVREGVRATLRTKPEEFDTLQGALSYAMKKLTIPLRHWIASSTLLKESLFQSKITDYVKDG